MIPVIAFTGPSGSGKTTLLEKVIRQLSERNIRVGTIKHHLKALDVDHKGKDSWRHKNAGAKAVVIATPEATAAIRNEDREPDIIEIAERYLFDVDIVLAEGYKTADAPSIVVLREEVKKGFELSGIRKPIALVTDTDMVAGKIPKFSLDDAKAVADFIVEKYIVPEKKRRVNLFVNGKTVPMKNFVRDLLENTVRGLISTFRGTENARKITIIIDED